MSIQSRCSIAKVTSSMVNTVFSGGKPTLDTKVSGLEKCIFYYGPGMQRQWVESNALFMDYVGNKYGQSTQVSLTKGELVVLEVDKKLLPRFDTKDKRDKHVAGLKFWE